MLLTPAYFKIEIAVSSHELLLAGEYGFEPRQWCTFRINYWRFSMVNAVEVALRERWHRFALVTGL
jgi:hypothetical protein